MSDLGTPSPSGLTNDFSNLSSTSIESLAQDERIQPRQMGTGVLRGTQRINNTDGSYITIGVIPNTNGEFGIAFFNSDGNLVSKSTGPTDYKYDVTTNKNYYQNGTLPDGSYGAIYAKSGYNVSDVIS